MTRIPELVAPAGWWTRLWNRACPACGALFPNGMWQMSAVGYPMHYAAAHLGIGPYERPGGAP